MPAVGPHRLVRLAPRPGLGLTGEDVLAFLEIAKPRRSAAENQKRSRDAPNPSSGLAFSDCHGDSRRDTATGILVSIFLRQLHPRVVLHLVPIQDRFFPSAFWRSAAVAKPSRSGSNYIDASGLLPRLTANEPAAAGPPDTAALRQLRTTGFFLGSAPAFIILRPQDQMKYRVLGKTGWNVSVLGFGAAPLGATYGPFREKDGIRAVHTAIDLGINFIDVAPYYGLTMAEAVLGKALRSVPREKYFLATKVGRHGPDAKDFDFSPERVTRSVDESLRRLRVAHIDLIQCQDIEYTSVPHLVEETIPALQKLKRQGKVRHIGVTGLPIKIFRKVLDHVSVDTVHSYCQFCLTNTTLVQLFPYLKEKRAGIINAAPLGMGLLTEKGPPKWHPAPAKVRDVCARAVAHCQKRKASLPHLALQFATSHRDIATTLVGTSDANKIKASVRCLNEPLDQSLLAEVQDILTPIRNESWPSGRKENN